MRTQTGGAVLDVVAQRVAVHREVRTLGPSRCRRAPGQATPRPRAVQRRSHLGEERVEVGGGEIEAGEPGAVLAVLPLELAVVARVVRRAVQDEDTVRRILDIRDQKGILCADEANHPACVPLREVVEGEVYPPLSYHADVFRVTAEARYGEVRRTVEAVVDRSEAENPVILAWRVR